MERSKKVPTFKDLDFLELHPDGIMLEPETYAALIKTIQRDCRVLESFKIMDYSLLLAIHNVDLAATEEAERGLNKLAKDERNVTENAGIRRITKPNQNSSTSRRRLVAHSTALESIQMKYDADVVTENIPYAIPFKKLFFLFIYVLFICCMFEQIRWCSSAQR